MEQTVNNNENKSILSMTTNPIIRKLTKIDETSESAVTYAGIAGKCGFFLVMIAIGVALAVVLQSISPMTMSVEGELVTFSVPAAAAAAVFSISESVFVIADGEGIMGAAGHQLPQRPDVAAHADPQRAPGETAGPAQVQI